jgi:hypothetical protein
VKIQNHWICATFPIGTVPAKLFMFPPDGPTGRHITHPKSGRLEMTNVNNARKSAFAALALGVVLFSFAGLDSTLKPSQAYAANATTQTTAQA